MCERGATDIHQHLWPEAVVEQLRIRTRPPRLDGWTLRLSGEPPIAVRPEDHDPLRRARLDPGLRRIAVSLSGSLGIEHLPPGEAAPLLDAWHQGARELPDPFVGWASAHTAEPDHDGLTALLDDRLIGLQLPATALATPTALEKLAPLLAVAEAAGKPVFVHPGPRPPSEEPTPPWWPTVVGHVGQLHAAWWSWYTAGRALLPRLRICFAAAAGLAPVHHERFTLRGGGRLRLDPCVFVDTSSYGRQALDAVARVLGIDALVLGSDRPCAAPGAPELGAAADHAVRVSNPCHLLEGVRP
ncbi:amidohydrolase [Streptomyces sp. NPDC005492]|uniref:amidohydrolase n=1 Tax=Streptomyces sp. NPDC005492 TaxID=3156883 RepID=UPI0033BC1391